MTVQWWVFYNERTESIAPCIHSDLAGKTTQCYGLDQPLKSTCSQTPSQIPCENASHYYGTKQYEQLENQGLMCQKDNIPEP